MRFWISVLCFFPLIAQAEPPADYFNVLSSVTVNFRGDENFDRAVLVQPSSDASSADLYLYLSTFNRTTGMNEVTLALKKEAAAFKAGMFGMQPTLSVNLRGSLEINSSNDRVGNTRWSQTLTIVYRKGEFWVAGINYASRDTEDSRLSNNCDLNLLRGRGKRNGRSVAADMKPVRLADWHDGLLPKACQF